MPLTVWWLVEDALVVALLLPVATVLWVAELLDCVTAKLVVTDTDVGVCDEPVHLKQ